MQKKCKEIAEMLLDYADGQLSHSQSSEVARHLAECPGCRSTLKALQKSLYLADIIWEDGLAETKAIHISIPQKTRRHHRVRYVAIAASILIVAGASFLWRAVNRPAEKEPTFAEIERKISESGNAARLLAAADLLAQYPNAQSIVKQQYSYIVKTYPETPAAVKAKLQIE